MKSRNSSNKAKKQIFEAKFVIILNCSSLETVCDLCVQRLSYKSTEIYLKKRRSSKTRF